MPQRAPGDAGLGRRVEAALEAWNSGVEALERRWAADEAAPREEPGDGAGAAAAEAAEAAGGAGGPAAQRRAKRPRTEGLWASNYAGFLARAKTFGAFTWFGKPATISKDVCAAHGWKNVAEDEVACASCKRKLSFREAEAAASAQGDGYDVAVQQFRDELERGHERLCPFGFSFVSRDVAQALLARKRREEAAHARDGAAADPAAQRDPESGATAPVSPGGAADGIDDGAARAERLLAHQIRLLAECAGPASQAR